ncbi:MAG: HAD-IB family phosphatase [Tahibacter sp.]
MLSKRDRMTVVLFDFDGVIVRKDSFESYLRVRLRRQPWRLLAVLPLLPFVPLLLATVAGKGWLARLFVRVSTCGIGEAGFRADIDAFGREFARRPGMLAEEALSRLRAHVASGERVLIVSAAAQPLLDAILDQAGVTGVEAVGSSVVVGWTGVRALFHNYGSAKLQTLASLGIEPPWAMAYSDSRSDLPILAAARHAVLVNPPQRDLDAVRRALGDQVEVLRSS